METKLEELLPKRGLYIIGTIVQAIRHRIAVKSYDRVQEVTAVNSTLCPSAYLAANQRKHEIETEKATATFMSRHERWKAGGPL